MTIENSVINRHFINPNGENRKTVDNTIYTVINTVIDQLSDASNTSPLPQWNHWAPPTTLQQEGRELEPLLNDLTTLLSGSMNPAHPGFIGHMDSMPFTLAILGSFISSALNNNMLSVEMSPTLSRLEKDCIQDICTWFGYDQHASGLMLSGGTLANLQALTVARNDHLKCQADGIQNREKSSVILASEAAHTSLEKAMMILGLGTHSLIKVKTDAQFRMDTKDLQNAIHYCHANGYIPFCVVATAGTTTTGSIDPLHAIAKICQKEQLWMHVDAAYGGSLVLSEEHKTLLTGIENADSITFNPQKWLYQPKTSAILLFRDTKRWHNAFNIDTPYVSSANDMSNFGDISVQGSRHADILKLWLSLQHIGKKGLSTLLNHSMDNTRYFLEKLKNKNYLHICCQPQLNIICFCIQVPDYSTAKNSFWTMRLQEHLNKKNIAYFSLATINNKKYLRAVLLNPYLNKEHIASIFNEIDIFKKHSICSSIQE